MAYDMQQWAALHHVRHLPSVPGAATVGGGIASGAEIAGSVGGLLGAAVAVVGLFLTIAANNAKRRKEYEREMREAEERGEERFREDMIFWRSLYFASRGDAAAVPVPPSQRRLRRPDDLDEQDPAL